MNKELVIWVVYLNPKDYPEKFVGRRFGEGGPTEEYFVAEHLKEVRDWVRAQAKEFGIEPPCMLSRHEDDDPVILETWI